MTTTNRRSVPVSLTILIVAALAIAVVWLLRPDSGSVSQFEQAPLPWKITTFSDGTSEVFRLHLGEVTVAQLLQQLGEDHELAIISDDNDRSGLEIFYTSFSAGPIKGKLIARVNASQETLETMQANAASSSYIDTGSRKFLLNANDLQRIQGWTIAGLSFVPAANLSDEVIVARFGEPARKVPAEDAVHYFYPQKGLHIARSDKAKELLQYVAPRDFARLELPHSGSGDVSPGE